MQTSYRFSAPGRTEISGNHTDHQHGCVLAAAVDLETTAEVTLRPDSIIRVASEGYAPVEIDLNDLSVHAEEKNTTAALVRGVAAAFAQRGCKLQGFDAAVGGGNINLTLENTLPYAIRYQFFDCDGVLTCCIENKVDKPGYLEALRDVMEQEGIRVLEAVHIS